MKVQTTPAENNIPESVHDALDKLNDAVCSPATAGDPEGQTMKAKDVPVGGVFAWKGEYYKRVSGRAIKSDKDRMTLKRPCRAVQIGSGDVVGLNKATVTYYPNATLHL